MGWGNEEPLARLKREHAGRKALVARVEAAEAAVARVLRLIEQEPVTVTTWLLRAALSDPANCALCISPFAECGVH